MHLQTFRASSQTVASGSDETLASTATMSSSSQPVLSEERTVTVHPVFEVDEEDAGDVSIDTADRSQDEVSDVTKPLRDGSDETRVSSSPTDVDAGARSDMSDDGQKDEDEDNTCIALPNDFSVILLWTELQYFLPTDDSRGLVGDWAELMYRKFNDVYPTCALRFHYNYCRKRNSRKTSSPFWLGRQHVVLATALPSP